MSSAPPPAAPELREVRAEEGGVRYEAHGPWTLQALIGRCACPQMPRGARARSASWDLRRAQLDAVGADLFWRAWGHGRPARLQLTEAQQGVFERLQAIPRVAPKPSAARFDALGPVLAVGRESLRFVDHLRAAVALLGHIVFDALDLSRRAVRLPWREITATLYRTGAQALPITALVGFLIGIVLSFLSLKQLRTFGADIYIVNILGISIVRELGPVLAAILVAGRSGSAMTAQLGVMRLTQELDALSVMGIRHSLRLVFPKVAALAVALPLIVLWTCAVALLGGAIAANLQVDFSVWYFLTRIPSVVPIANLWLGVGKAVVFGIAIALVACHFGLRIRPNTQSLGAGTTSSVVTAITSVIVIDAIFAVAFSNIGLV